MEIIALDVKTREKQGKSAARAVRKEGSIPGVIYGGKDAPITVSIEKRAFAIAQNQGNLKARRVELNTEKGTIAVLPKELQTHPVTDEVLHVDFLRLEKDKKIKVLVKTSFSGHERSAGIKRGGILNIVRRRIECWCDPDHIPAELLVDISDLSIGESKKISNIDLPKGVSPTIDDRDFTIAAIVGRAKKEEEDVLATAAEETDGSEEAEESEKA